MVNEGDKAPSFNLPDQDGVKHSLASFKGSWLVMFVYPKANTGG